MDNDTVTSPSHYLSGGIEPLVFIASHNMNFLEGNIIKYVTRYKHKDGIRDLKKAAEYLRRLIEFVESGGKPPAIKFNVPGHIPEAFGFVGGEVSVASNGAGLPASIRSSVPKVGDILYV